MMLQLSVEEGSFGMSSLRSSYKEGDSIFRQLMLLWVLVLFLKRKSISL